MIIKTTAILLQSRKYKEKDKLLTFFTSDLGRILVLCKSSRSSLHRWGCSTEPPVFGYIQLYEKKGFYTLTEICAVESLWSPASSLSSLLIFQYFAHVLDRFLPYGNPQPELFQKAQSVFFQWKAKQKEGLFYLFQFLVFFLASQGYAQPWQTCSHCGKSLENNAIEYIYCNFSQGVICCKNCTGAYHGLLTIENPVRHLLSKMFQEKPLNEEEYQLFTTHWMQIDKILSTFFSQVLDQRFASLVHTYASLKVDWIEEKEKL